MITNIGCINQFKHIQEIQHCNKPTAMQSQLMADGDQIQLAHLNDSSAGNRTNFSNPGVSILGYM